MPVALLGAPFLPFLFGFVPGEATLSGLLLALAGVASPAIASGLALRARDTPTFVTFGLAGATGLIVLTLALRLAFGLPDSPPVLAALLGGLTVATAIVGVRRGLPDRSALGVPGTVALSAMLLATFSGTVVVPPLEDQDSEVQGTAYGWVHDLQPLCLTNRSTIYFFAHPPLLHLHNAATLGLGGDLETVRPPRDVAARARDSARPPAGGIVSRALATLRGETRTVDRSRQWYVEVYRPFLEEPVLAATRAPNFAWAAAVALLLLSAARRLGASTPDAVLAIAAYVTLPEIFVRSAYGGYYALTAATLLAGVALAVRPSGGRVPAGLAGGLAVLANQKAVVVGGAIALARGTAAVTSRSLRALAPAAPWWIGLAIGGAAFWIYGLSVSPEEFVRDHVLEHGVHRFSGGEVVSRSGESVYASRLGIWAEFVRHFGAAWCALAVAALAAAGMRVRKTAADPARLETGTMLAWTVIGAILFTATDWRQTKHLSLLVPAVVPLIAVLASSRGPRAAWVVRGGLVLAVAWNVSWIVRLARDFAAMSVTPVW